MPVPVCDSPAVGREGTMSLCPGHGTADNPARRWKPRKEKSRAQPAWSSQPEGRFLVSLYSLCVIDLGRNKSRRDTVAGFNTVPCKKTWQGCGVWGRSTSRWRPSSPPPPRTFHFIPDRAYLCSSLSITVRTACKQFF